MPSGRALVKVSGPNLRVPVLSEVFPAGLEKPAVVADQAHQGEPLLVKCECGRLISVWCLPLCSMECMAYGCIPP